MSEYPEAHVNKVMEQFVQDFMTCGPYSEYISACGDSDRGRVERAKQGGTRSLEEVREDLIKRGENPDEPYLVIFLREPFPDGLRLPAEREGVKLYVTVVAGDKMEFFSLFMDKY
ncbi:hypothetical protein MYX07_03485 [Patescibacteria group bacterium AH-259-L07]|nr:hypothetical protein [Patescibacteria group bacterium AH-259-L07]